MAGYTRHLWYIISLFSIFILCAVFRNTLQKCPPVILLAVFSVISFYSARLNTSVFQVHQTTYYLLYFYVGMLVDRYWDGFFGIIRRGRHVFFAAGIAAVVYYTLYSEIKYIAAFGFILAGFSLAAMVNTEKASGNRLYEMLRRDSFGVYLFHPMMLYLLYYRLRGEVLNPYIWGVLSMTGVYIASVALSELFRCLGLGLLLGEKPEKVRSREESSEKLP